jgi:hypothetical protein
MQNIKDSFYIELRDRLAALDPQRTVTMQGVVRPAVVVLENELPGAQPLEPGVFYLRWCAADAVRHADDAPQPLLKLGCEIRYRAAGSETASFQDRGRELALADDILLGICHPPSAVLRDFSQVPAQSLGGNLFWSRPRLQAVEEAGRWLSRTAQVDVFAFAEVDC